LEQRVSTGFYFGGGMRLFSDDTFYARLSSVGCWDKTVGASDRSPLLHRDARRGVRRFA
jgi:hypothetical protein